MLHFDDHDSLRSYMTRTEPVWVIDEEAGGLWWTNPAGLRFWGAGSVAELAAMDWSGDTVLDRAQLREKSHVLASGEPVQETCTIVAKGKLRQTLVLARSVTILSGRAATLFEIVRCLESLDAAEDVRISRVFNAISLLISSFSMTGKLLAQSPAAAQCYGPNPEAADKSRSDLEFRFDQADLCHSLLARVADGEDFTWEVRARTLRGPRTHLVSARQGKDPVTGETVAVLCEQDVTDLAAWRVRQERINAELAHTVNERTEQLQISQKRFDLALETAAIWDWDLKSERLFMSDKFIGHLGYSPEDFRDMVSLECLSAIVHPDDLAAYLAEVKRHVTEPYRQIVSEHRFVSKSGESVWFLAQGKCILDAEGKPMRSVGLLTDVTERKNLEAQLLAAQRMEAIGQLTGGIAHEFNNLLTIIQGNAELLQEVSGVEEGLVSDISGAVQRGASLTSHLLSFSRQQTLHPRSVHLPDLLGGLRKTLLRALREDVSIRVVDTGGIWTVLADPTQIEAAVLNIALNARDAMPKGGELVMECRNCEISAVTANATGGLAAGRYVELRITDTGTGMDSKTLARAFEPFFTTKDVGKGSGLGLSMVMGFARQSGGDCCIDSVAGEGTTVLLMLPAGEAPEVRSSDGIAEAIVVGRGEHIHLVEDNEQVRAAVASQIEGLGYRVTQSEDAPSVLAAVAGGLAPRLFLVDVMLSGGMSGLEAAEVLEMIRPQSRIILMSGSHGMQSGQASVGRLRFDLVAKPFDRTRLSHILGAALRADA